MGLKKKFNNHREKQQLKKVLKSLKKSEPVDQRLNDLADRLQTEIQKNTGKPSMYFEIAGLENYPSATPFSGYERLHDICAAKNIRIEKAMRYSGSLTYMRVYSGIEVKVNQPYSSSPDAKFFEKKRPVQLKFPGL